MKLSCRRHCLDVACAPLDIVVSRWTTGVDSQYVVVDMKLDGRVLHRSIVRAGLDTCCSTLIANRVSAPSGVGVWSHVWC